DQVDTNMNFQGDACESTIVQGPDGATIVLPFNPAADFDFKIDCTDVPPQLMMTQFGPCLRATPRREITGPSKVCFPNPMDFTFAYVVRCEPPEATIPPSCRSSVADGGLVTRAYLFGGRCCTILRGTATGVDPICGDVDTFGATFVAGVPTDTDQDFSADF